jgi:nitric oxide reductase large subunit
VVFGIQKLSESSVSSVWNWLIFILWLYWLYYVYRAMRNFYKQGRFKTIVKYILLNFFAFITIIFLFAIFFTYSVLET